MRIYATNTTDIGVYDVVITGTLDSVQYLGSATQLLPTDIEVEKRWSSDPELVSVNSRRTLEQRRSSTDTDDRSRSAKARYGAERRRRPGIGAKPEV